ncbi:MAG: hypothetical protein HC802_21245 [Caldilineaceae bacterium]|nr:hypothetical protein [Caldilineaceae bacterium]
MQRYLIATFATLLLFATALAMPPNSAFGGVPAQDAAQSAVEEDGAELATASVSAELVQSGRAVVSARGNHFIVDSVPPLGGLNEERNPLHIFLGALATCSMFVYEGAAAELGIPLDALSVKVEGDFAPQGLVDGSVSPRVRAFRVLIDMQGPSADEADLLADQFSKRCPIYTTLERSAPIEIIHVGMDDIGALLEVDFTYDYDSAAELEAEVGPLAETYAALPGLRWKIWIIDAAEKRFGAVYLFENAEARTAYLESDLAAAVAAHPHLSDGRVVEFDVMGAESLVTRGPVTSQFVNSGEGIGAMLQVDFDYNVTTDEYIAEVSPMADQFAAIDGLRWKSWIIDEENQRAGAVYFFDSPEARAAYLESDLAAAVAGHPALSDLRVVPFDVLAEPSLVTYAPIGTLGE